MNKNKFATLASNSSVEKAATALTSHGITVHITDDPSQTKKLVYSLIPKGAEVMTATSTTLNQLGLTDEINNSIHHNSVKSQLSKLNREKDKSSDAKIGGRS